MQSLSGHYLMRQNVPMVFLLLLVYLGYCCLHFCRNKFWAHFGAGIFYGSKVKHYSQIATFYDSV